MTRPEHYAYAVAMCVQQGIAEKMTTSEILEPLITQIAKVAAATARSQKFKVDDLIEIVRHDLDRKVTEYDRLNPN